MQIASVNNFIADIAKQFSTQMTDVWLLVITDNQCMYVINVDSVESSYAVSTSKYGLGETQDSYKTPRGAHTIEQKLGAQCEMHEILRARQATGECAQIISEALSSQEDLILTRVLWLKGLETGKNLGEGIDSFQRYIYIHGTQEEGLIGKPASHGCVRMLNKDVIELYDQVNEGTFVYIA